MLSSRHDMHHHSSSALTPRAARNFPLSHLHTIKTHAGPVNAICFSSASGRYLLTGSSDRYIHLTRALPSGKTGDAASLEVPVTTSPIHKYNNHGYSVLDLAVSQDNSRFASAESGRGVSLWDVETGTTVRRWDGHEGRVETVRFGGVEDSVLVSGSADATVKIWDTRALSSYKPIQTLSEAKDTVSSVSVHNASPLIVSGSYDGRTRIYDLRVGRMLVDILCVRGNGAVTSVDCTRDGQAVLASCLDDRIRLLDCRDGTVLKGFGGSNIHGSTAIRSVGDGAGRDYGDDFDPEDLDYTYKNQEMRIRSTLAMGESMVISGGEAVTTRKDGVRSLAGSNPHGGGEEGRVFAWDVLTGDMVASVGMGKGVNLVGCVACNAKDKSWAAGCSDGSVQVFGEDSS